MSKLNFYYHRPTISPTPVDILLEENQVNNLKRKNKLLWSGIFILILVIPLLLEHSTLNYDIKKKKSP